MPAKIWFLLCMSCAWAYLTKKQYASFVHSFWVFSLVSVHQTKSRSFAVVPQNNQFTAQSLLYLVLLNWLYWVNTPQKKNKIKCDNTFVCDLVSQKHVSCFVKIFIIVEVCHKCLYLNFIQQKNNRKNLSCDCSGEK